MGHLGTRVSALLDGRLAEADEERCWEHVHLCHPCRDLVEREGWLKTQLAELSWAPARARADDSLKSGLLAASLMERLAAESDLPAESFLSRHRALVLLGTSAAGVAFLGVAVMSGLPGQVGDPGRRAPTTNVVRPVTPQIVPGHHLRRNTDRGVGVRGVQAEVVHEKMAG